MQNHPLHWEPQPETHVASVARWPFLLYIFSFAFINKAYFQNTCKTCEYEYLDEYLVETKFYDFKYSR
ncbi:hypothetical protein RCL_jg9783.t1 [Rhizophagus clarus]|uniref:Uncharacterized protein n=1 Tax=Rhizophagus clarus TaxID=94130 RepID=A0A8H3QXV8_9GLOM|nr:hypothetical protein RCL_jg9783.t1 [Rhizophagus clarus]